MIWLQTFAILVLSGLSQARNFFDDEADFRSDTASNPRYDDIYYNLNSFPYYHFSQGTHDEMYMSSIVSLSTGPLCSGFHITQNVVLTAASCVYRETPKDLTVISHVDGKCQGPLFSFLPVQKIVHHPNYNWTTDEHDLAVLIVSNVTSVPVLKLPTLSMQPDRSSTVLMTKFSMDDNMIRQFATVVPVEADFDIKRCTDGTFSVNAFLCVWQTDGQPFNFGLADLGTPLIYKSPEGDFLNGIYTGRAYNKPQTHHLYQNVYPNLPFLYAFVNS